MSDLYGIATQAQLSLPHLTSSPPRGLPRDAARQALGAALEQEMPSAIHVLTDVIHDHGIAGMTEAMHELAQILAVSLRFQGGVAAAPVLSVDESKTRDEAERHLTVTSAEAASAVLAGYCMSDPTLVQQGIARVSEREDLAIAAATMLLMASAQHLQAVEDTAAQARSVWRCRSAD